MVIMMGFSSTESSVIPLGCSPLWISIDLSGYPFALRVSVRNSSICTWSTLQIYRALWKRFNETPFVGYYWETGELNVLHRLSCFMANCIVPSGHLAIKTSRKGRLLSFSLSCVAGRFWSIILWSLVYLQYSPSAEGWGVPNRNFQGKRMPWSVHRDSLKRKT